MKRTKSPSHKRFGFVQTLDTQSKRRLYEVLQSQGLQMNQEITFLSDGDDTLRELQLEMSPKADAYLGLVSPRATRSRPSNCLARYWP